MIADIKLTAMRMEIAINMLANLNVSLYTKLFRDIGWRSSKGKLFATFMFGFAMPMFLSDVIARTMLGRWDDEDDDGYLDEVAKAFFGSQLTGLTALAPVLGPSIKAGLNAFNDLPYDDRIMSSPAIAALEASFRGVADLWDEKRRGTGRNIKDVLTLVSLLTGVPVAALARPGGYLADMESGRAAPANPLDLLRGLVTGAPGKKP